MALSKYKLGELIQLEDERNSQGLYSIDDVKGISTGKEFIETKANMDGISLTSYKVVKTNEFAYVSDTSRRGDKIAIAFNNTNNGIIISSIYTVFSVKRNDLLLSDYLFMYFNRPEFDRYSRFNSWGSARETFSWEDFCDIEIDLPSLDIQQKYVDVYNAMLANQQTYERGLEDLKLVCDGYVEDLRRNNKLCSIGHHIELSENKNDDLNYGIEAVRGISIEKKLIDTKADMSGVSLKPYYLLKPEEFAFVSVTSRNGGRISLAINDTQETYICSSSYIVFRCKDKKELLPQYLMLFLSRDEFDRYARFNSWGSAREVFTFEDMKEVEIPIPDIEIQKSIVNIYNCYIERKRINEQLKSQIKDLCPILIKGSIEEGRK